MHTIQEKLVLQLRQREKYTKKMLLPFSTTYVLKNSSILNEFAESLSKADQVFLCEIFGSIRENTGDLTIEDLINRIDGSTLIDENSIDVLEKFDNAVILFMGAGDIQKLLKAYFEKLGVKMILICLYKASWVLNINDFYFMVIRRRF